MDIILVEEKPMLADLLTSAKNYNLFIYSFEDVKGKFKHSPLNKTVVIISGENKESVKEVFLEFNRKSVYRNILIFLNKIDLNSARYFLKQGAFDALPLTVNEKELLNALKEAFSEENPHFQNRLLKREKALLKVIKDICLTLDLQPLLNLITDTAIDLIQGDSAEFYLFKNNDRKIEPALKRGELPVTVDFSILKRNNLAIVTKIEEKGTVIYIPLLRDGTWNVTLILGIKNDVWEETRGQVYFLKTLQKEIAPAIKNTLEVEQTRHLTDLDDLTQCYNRRYFDRTVNEILQKSIEHSENLSIIFMDLDNLKSVNTRYGHMVGSQVLQAIAIKIIEAVRGIDKVARFGGDEFCIILPETDSQGAYRVAERIKRNIEGKESLLPEFPEIKVTASFGIASYPEHADNIKSLIKIADNAMYYVKMSTKNSIFIPGQNNGK
jgi:diguanylate cyclase (GGDEF)-like protein